MLFFLGGFLTILSLPSWASIKKGRDFEEVRVPKKNAYYRFYDEGCRFEFKNKEFLVEVFEEVKALLSFVDAYEKSRTRVGDLASLLVPFRNVEGEKNQLIKLKTLSVDEKLKRFKRQNKTDAMGTFYLNLLKERYDLASTHTQYYFEAFEKIYENLSKVPDSLKVINLSPELRNKMMHQLLGDNLHLKIKQKSFQYLKKKEVYWKDILAKKLPLTLNILKVSQKALTGFSKCSQQMADARRHLGKGGQSFAENQDVTTPVNTILY